MKSVLEILIEVCRQTKKKDLLSFIGLSKGDKSVGSPVESRGGRKEGEGSSLRMGTPTRPSVGVGSRPQAECVFGVQQSP